MKVQECNIAVLKKRDTNPGVKKDECKSNDLN